MKKSKRIWSFLLALCLIVTQLPATALAESNTIKVANTELTVGTPYLTNQNGDITTDGADFSNYNVYLEKNDEKYTLTLNGAYIKGQINNQPGINYYGNEGLPLEIVLKGNNEIYASDEFSNGVAILSTEDLIISGDGALIASALEGSSIENTYTSYGIECTSLTILGGEITVIAGNVNGMQSGSCSAAAIKSKGEVNIKGGTIYANCSFEEGEIVPKGGEVASNTLGFGIYVGDGGDHINITGGTIYAHGLNGGHTSYGIYTDGTIAIGGDAKVTAEGKATTDNSIGIGAGSNVAITGSATVVAKGGAASKGNSYGIAAPAGVDISDNANVTAEGGEVTENYGISHGIGSQTYITISGGTVKATGKAAKGTPGFSYGIGAVGDITISNGANVEATAGTVTYGYSYGIGTRGNITFADAATTVTGKGGYAEAGNSYGIGTTGMVTIHDGTIIGEADAAPKGHSYGIGSGAEKGNDDTETVSLMSVAETGASSGYGIVMIGGKVTAKGKDAKGSVGLTTAGDFTMQGGIITAEGGTANSEGETGDLNGAKMANNSYGVGIVGDATISGGEINADGGKAIGGNSYGVAVVKDIQITGGKIDADAKSASNGHSIGLGAGNAIVTSGEIDATGQTATGGNSYGIGTTGSFDMDGGNVTATSGKATSATETQLVSTMSITRSGEDTITSGLSCGIGSLEEITLDGTGTLKAKAGSGDVYSFGCVSEKKISGDITDMKLDISGDSSAFSTSSGGAILLKKDGEEIDVTGKTFKIGVTSTPGYTGGGYYTPTYNVTVTAGEGGTITSTGNNIVYMGQSKTYTITPNEGYVIVDVLVDGVSVGAVESYTFENVQATHTIEAIFAKEKNDASTDEPEKNDKSYMSMQLKSQKSTKTSNKLKWKAVENADGYIVKYAKYNEEKGKFGSWHKEIIEDGDAVSYKVENLKEGSYYKFVVKAYKLVDGRKEKIAKAKAVLAATKGGEYGNVVSVQLASKEAVLETGKTWGIEAAVTTEEGKKFIEYRAIKFESDNTKVASVDKNGVVTAKKAGTCTVYVYAQNGACKKVKITVK